MPLKFFHVRSADPALEEERLAGFVASHRVVTVERHLVADGANSFWAVCVDYVTGPAGVGSQHGAPGRAARKVDYREVLSAEQFEIFARLRDLRKQFADREAVPVYSIFTNAQLAAMVEQQVADKRGLRVIGGVGEARVEKYGEAFLALLARNFAADEGKGAKGTDDGDGDGS